MAFIQKNTPPPNKIMTFSLKNFAGGLNNRSQLLEDNQAYNLVNMRFTDDTVMEKRFGSARVDEINVGAPITFMDEYRPYHAHDQLIRSTSEKMYVNDTELTTLHGDMCGVNFRGKYYFADGASLRVYGTFGSETTTYEKIIGEAVETNVLMEVVNPPEDFTPLDKEHVKGVVVVDYTNYKVWYEPCALEIEDPYKGANVLPENPKYVVSHKGRLFVSGSEKDDDNIFITDINNPYYFAVSLPIQIPPNSDKVRGLHVYDDSVVVGRKEDLYAIHGMTNNPELGIEVFQLRKLNAHTGFANHNAISVAHNYLFFLGSDGNAYSLSSTHHDEKTMTTSILSRQINLFSFPIDLKRTDVESATSVFFDDEWYISMKDKVLVYNYRHLAWTMYNHLDIRSFYKKGTQLVWGNERGDTLTFSNDYLDEGIPYRAFWSSKVFDMDDANSNKQFREFFIVAHTFFEYKSDIRLTFEVDYVDVDDSVVINNQIAIWGRSRFGERFITRNINASLPFVIGRRARGIRFTFSNSYDVDGVVDTLSELETYQGKTEGLLVECNETNAYHLYTGGAWKQLEEEDYNQAMRMYQVNGDYEIRGKR